MNEKAYELRDLTADDMFPMFGIISKIGIKEFKGCFEAPDVKQAISAMSNGGKDDGSDLSAIGLTVAVDVGNVLMKNLPNCKEEIYTFLAQISGMKNEEIAALPIGTFTAMIVDVVKKEEFKDFFQAVSGLFS